MNAVNRLLSALMLLFVLGLINPNSFFELNFSGSDPFKMRIFCGSMENILTRKSVEFSRHIQTNKKDHARTLGNNG